ncbi:MAG: GNAT family N-acetyltransferase [Alphaproteobacteria bacterium]|nr:GNAT family N-acetyltransferase [Alphaproteobacteria bacterium]MCB9929469.1 GNAT family N-acetyltransferase [Alphaproteobacteria bacterium]
MVDVVSAHPDQRDDVARFMQTVFPRAKWPLAGWQALLAGRWNRPGDPYAIVAMDGDRIAGALAMIMAERMTDRGPHRTANLSSWYVLADYRGQRVGQRMLALALSDPSVTITDFTASKMVIPGVQRAGLRVLDQERCLWHRSADAGARWPIHRDPLALGEALAAADRRVLEDHEGLSLTPLAIETPDGLCVLILSVQRKGPDYLTYEVLYAGDRVLLTRYARAIADSILPDDGAVFSVDRRFLTGPVACDREQEIPVPRLYRPAQLEPGEIDKLYSEVVLLNMKLD